MSNMPASITFEGRLAVDPDLNVDPATGRKSIRVPVIQNKGYSKETEHTISFSCYFGGYEAERLVKAKVQKGSLITIAGNFDSHEYMKQDPNNPHDPNAKIHERSLDVNVWTWWYTPQNKPKDDANAANGQAPAAQGGYPNNGQYAPPAQNQMPPQNAMPAQNQPVNTGVYQPPQGNGSPQPAPNNYQMPPNGYAAGANDGFQSVQQEELPFNN